MKKTIATIIENKKTRSAWGKGVKLYALELLDSFGDGEEITEKNALNGADNWSAYSWGGCALIYNEDIAVRLCTPSELKKTRCGERRPNSREEWLDVQARALYQAWLLIARAKRKIEYAEKVSA